MVLDLRSSDVSSIMITALPILTPKTTVATALRLMREHGISTLPVSSDDGMQGLVNEKTLLRYTPSEATTLDVYELRDVLDRLTVQRATVAPRAVVAPHARLDEAAALMLRTDTDVVAVMEAGRFVGLVTWCGLLAAAVGTPRPV
jgi:acetoin utilization protein AcuB